MRAVIAGAGLEPGIRKSVKFRRLVSEGDPAGALFPCEELETRAFGVALDARIKFIGLAAVLSTRA